MFRKDKSFLSHIQKITSDAEINAVTREHEILTNIDNILDKHITKLQNNFIDECVNKIELAAEMSFKSVGVGQFIDSSKIINITGMNDNDIKHNINLLTLKDITSIDKKPPISIQYRGFHRVVYGSNLLPTVESLVKLLQEHEKLNGFTIKFSNYMENDGQYGKMIEISW